MDYSSINWLAVITATLASFALGALWYSPVLFSKIWQREVGLKDEDIKSANMAKIFGTCLVLTAFMAVGMAFLIQGHQAKEISVLSGVMHGVFIGICFVASSIGINYLYQRKSFILWFIDAGYQMSFLALMGFILAAWR
ncbi:MAG: DUF1761 domain-containing protein [Crocinitomicaceae bacterium]|nr:DUF1761 domain-containing protein [Crocinitomicaceae bacterium]MBK8926003.1 DUF1761 domain-containing protein [Crocinitomicaceae bacterium]